MLCVVVLHVRIGTCIVVYVPSIAEQHLPVPAMQSDSNHGLFVEGGDLLSVMTDVMPLTRSCAHVFCSLPLQQAVTCWPLGLQAGCMTEQQLSRETRIDA